MSLAGFSVSRPVLTTMVTLMVMLIGVASLRQIRIDLLPAIERPTLSVTTNYEGADPEVVERLVTQTMEEILATVPGVTEMVSSSSEGRSDIDLTFVWGTNIDVAAQDVRAQIEQELNELPDEIERPQVRKFNISNFPVVVLGISSDIDPVELNDLVENQLANRFTRIAGVAQLDMWGGYAREVRIELLPDRVRALGLSLNGILDAIRAANVDLPAGTIDEARLEVTLRAPSEFTSLDDIGGTVITVRDGAAISLNQVAEVRETYERQNRLVRVNGKRGVRAAIRKEPHANTVEVAQRILDEIDAINRDMPFISVVPVINQGNFIERSIDNVAQSVLYGGALAVIILLFFLRNLRSTLVIGLAIPISILATFSLIYAGGLTLNLMTLGGLALGVGMMVDNSIVVLENIFRRRDEANEDIGTAAVTGSGEVAGAVIASTITTLVIFLPLVFVRGVSGMLFQELALVVVLSLIASLIVALGLVPMLADKLLRQPRIQPGTRSWTHRLALKAGGIFDYLDRAYRDLLHVVLRWRLVTIALTAVVLGASLFLAPHIGSEFMPPSDEGEVRISGEMESGMRLDLADELARRQEAIVFAALPEAISSVATVMASGRGGNAAARSEIQISLGPSSARDRSNTEIADDLRQRLEGQIPGVTVRTRAPQGQFLLERLLGGDEGLEIEIRGFDLSILGLLSQQVEAVIADIPGITDVESNSEEGVPQQRIVVDRNKVADVGLTVREVAEALEIAVAGRSAGDYRPQGYSYRMLVQLKDVETMALDDILDQTLATPSGEQVAMRNLVTTVPGQGPAVINRKDQQRTITVEANVSGRDLGSVARDVQDRLATIPARTGYEMLVTGAYEEQQESFRELIISFLLALVLVYMVLASQYESLRDPLVVMFSVPVAAIGVLVTLFLTGSTFNVQSAIGCIMLGGIVVNNAILLVDQAGQLRTQGMATAAAVAEAGRRRLRPILMTTLTTILGLLPLALGIGEGADAQAPLARAVVGGLIASTLITLLLIPVIYTLFHPERRPVLD